WTQWLLYRLMTLLLLVGLFMTKVRGAELSLAGSALYLLGVFISPWGRGLAKTHLRFLLAAFGILALAGGFYVWKHGGLSSFGAAEASVQQRVALYKGAWEIVKDKPLTGIGLGHVGIQFPHYQARPYAPSQYPDHPFTYTEHIHNEFLQFWVEGGLPGLGLFLALLG